MKNDYTRGFNYALDGVRDFYKYKFLWKYTLLPLITVLIIHIAIWIFTVIYLQPLLVQKISGILPEWLLKMIDLPLPVIAAVLSWTAALIVLAMLTNLIYEFIGSFFFPEMVKEYTRRVLQIQSAELKMPDLLRNCLAATGLNLQIVILLVLLSWMVVFLPVIGMFFFMMIMGYLYSILFMSEAAFIRSCRLSDIRYLFANRAGLMYGFGMVSFFAVQIPFLSPLLYAGFVIGGTKMFNEEAEGI